MVIDKTNDEHNAAIAAALTEAKKTLGITFEELAERSSLTVRTVKRYLNNERLMSVRAVIALSAALDVKAFKIIEDAERGVEQAGGSDTAAVSESDDITSQDTLNRAAQ